MGAARNLIVVVFAACLLGACLKQSAERLSPRAKWCIEVNKSRIPWSSTNDVKVSAIADYCQRAVRLKALDSTGEPNSRGRASIQLCRNKWKNSGQSELEKLEKIEGISGSDSYANRYSENHLLAHCYIAYAREQLRSDGVIQYEADSLDGAWQPDINPR